MIREILLIIFGFLLGLEHSLDIDHVVAVSTILAENRSIRGSMATGILWGVGHTSIILLAGSIILTLSLAIPEYIINLLDIPVGIMLVILGLWILLKPGEYIDDSQAELGGGQGIKHGGGVNRLKPLLVGMVHGLAGSAPLILIILTSIGSIALGLIYIISFGLGSIIGMLAVSALLGIPYTYTYRRHISIHRFIRITSGLLSILIGSIILYNILK